MRTGTRTVLIGAGVALAGAMVLLSPTLLGRGVLAKYVIAIGFLGVCLGLALLLNGAVDWFTRR